MSPKHPRHRLRRTVRISRYVIYRETLADYREMFWSFFGAFFGIGLIAYLQSLNFDETVNVFLIGSFGASAVLVYGAIHSPLAQPRNLVGGHLISAVVGVSAAKILPDIIWLQAPAAVALSIIAMQFTKTLHPPGGATALIAVTGGSAIRELGYVYVLNPVFTGVLILLLVALIFNNITYKRTYPTNSAFVLGLKRRLRQRHINRKIRIRTKKNDFPSRKI